LDPGSFAPLAKQKSVNICDLFLFLKIKVGRKSGEKQNIFSKNRQNEQIFFNFCELGV